MNRLIISVAFSIAPLITYAQVPGWSDEIQGKAESFVVGFLEGQPVISQEYPLAKKATISILKSDGKTFRQVSLPAPGQAGKAFARTFVSKHGVEQVVLESSKEETCLFVQRFNSKLEAVANYPLYCVPKKGSYTGLGQEITFSPDSTKVLFIHLTTPDFGFTYLVHYNVYNSADWSVLHKGTFESAKAGKAFVNTRKLIVENDGTITQFIRVQRTVQEQKKGLKNDRILSRISPNGNIEEKILQSSILYPTASIYQGLPGKFFMAGFKLTLNTETLQVGYDLVINDLSKITSDTIKVQANWKLDGLFPPLEPGAKVKNNPEFDPFVIRSFDESADGTFTITAEQVGNDPQTANNLGKLAVIQAQPNGPVKIHLMPRFKTIGDNSIYLTGPYKGGWCVLYDDEVATLPATDWSSYMKLTSTTNFNNKDQGLILWTIDAQGNSSKKLIYAYTGGAAPELHRSRILQGGTFLLAAKKSFGWLSLKEN